jgi:hypothetical protein|tara:strand:- start:124 stop:1332 length:1209 start_codon:yes stop_codon:yes gene_type:complete
MAIKTFKEIINDKGYRISSKDRAIFEEGKLQSFFGFTDSDMIEFIVYDVNDNQLPQGEDGELIRYIPMNSENIKDYFLVADGTTFQAFQFPNEYFIDAERLINEAGYDNGIFKTQITLLNKRVGYESPNEKLWIKEISPSRTEVKLLPLRNDKADKTDLLQRFNVMVSGKDFREDIVPYIPQFIESITPSTIDSFIKKIYTKKWYAKMVAEFGIAGFDILMKKIHSKFTEAMFNEFSNRYSSIDSNNYGNPKPRPASLTFAIDDVFKVAQRIIVECIEYYLPKRTIQTKTEIDKIFDESYDKVGKVLQRRESDVVINAKPAIVNVTKKKNDTTDNPYIKDYELDEEIKKEIPKDTRIPKFSKPNPSKSTKISAVQSNIQTNTNSLQNSNSYAVGGGGGGSDS